MVHGLGFDYLLSWGGTNMAFHQSAARRQAAPDDYVAHYRREGFAIVRGVFSADEVRSIGTAIDALHAEGVAHGRSFRHGNLFYRVAAAEDGRPAVPMVNGHPTTSPC
jgi:hypothetical protein